MGRRRTPTALRKKSSRKLQYEAYLRSPHWKQLRSQATRRDEGCKAKRAAECGGRLHVHHHRYPANLEDGTLGDVVTLCASHHKLVHRIVAKQKKSLSDATQGVLSGLYFDPDTVIAKPKKKTRKIKKPEATVKAGNRRVTASPRCSRCKAQHKPSEPFVRCSCGGVFR